MDPDVARQRLDEERVRLEETKATFDDEHLRDESEGDSTSELSSIDQHPADDAIIKHYDLMIGPRKLRAVSVKLSFELYSKNRGALRGIKRCQVVSQSVAEQLAQEVFVVGIYWTQRNRHRFEPQKFSYTT